MLGHTLCCFWHINGTVVGVVACCSLAIQRGSFVVLLFFFLFLLFLWFSHKEIWYALDYHFVGKCEYGTIKCIWNFLEKVLLLSLLPLSYQHQYIYVCVCVEIECVCFIIILFNKLFWELNWHLRALKRSVCDSVRYSLAT